MRDVVTTVCDCFLGFLQIDSCIEAKNSWNCFLIDEEEGQEFYDEFSAKEADKVLGVVHLLDWDLLVLFLC